MQTGTKVARGAVASFRARLDESMEQSLSLSWHNLGYEVTLKVRLLDMLLF